MKLSTIYNLVMKAPEGRMPLGTFLRPLRRAFKPYPWIRFEQRRLKDADVVGLSDAVGVTGRFEPDYCDRSICFVTVSGYSDQPMNAIWFEGRMRQQLLFDIFATIAHERIHLLQSRRAKGCPRLYRAHHSDSTLEKKLSYYGSKIEIDAYAHTAALEERYGFRNEVLGRYREMFTPDDFRFKRFLKKKYKYGLTMFPNVI